MKRTQIYLDEDLARLLAAESRRRKTTVSWLIRDAAAQVYGSQPDGERPARIRRLAGVWADRADLADTDEAVRELRASTRESRWSKPHRVKVPARQ